MKKFVLPIFFLIFAISIGNILLQKNAFAQANTWPDYRGDMIGVPMGSSGAITSGILYCEPPISDTLPMICYLQGADAWPEATGANRVGGNIVECGGIGTRQVTIDNFAACAGAVVTVTIDSTVNTLTEGAQWNRGASNNAASVSLASAIASLTGISDAYTLGIGSVAYILPEITTCSLDLAETVAACTTLTEGTDGSIYVGTPVILPFVNATTNLGSASNRFGYIWAGFGVISGSAVYGSSATGLTNIELNGFITNPGANPLVLGVAAASSHALGTDDVLVGGILEVNGIAYFDSSLTIAGNINSSTNTIIGDVSYGSGIGPRITAQTPDTSMLLTGSLSNGWVLIEYADRGFDYQHTIQTNPTLFIHSANQSTTEWLGLTHNQTNGVITTGVGNLDVAAAAGGMRIARIISAAPAEPVACGTTTEGMMSYVNDTNDGAKAQVCICISIPDDATWDWVQIHDMTTACTFF